MPNGRMDEPTSLPRQSTWKPGMAPSSRDTQPTRAIIPFLRPKAEPEPTQDSEQDIQQTNYQHAPPAPLGTQPNYNNMGFVHSNTAARGYGNALPPGPAAGGWSPPANAGGFGPPAQGYGAPAQYGYGDPSGTYDLSPVDSVIQPNCIDGDCFTPGCESGVVATYGWARGSGGREYGVAEDWYSQVGIFAPLFTISHNGHFFVQGHGLIAEDDVYGTNIGIGYRQLMSPVIIGVSGWYDFERSRERSFNQLGASFEILTPDIDVRVNGYFPVANDERFVGVLPHFDRNNVIIGHTESVLQGVDAEISVPLTTTVRTSVGFYHYESPGNDVDEINGIRGVIDWSPEPRINIGLLLGHDDFFDTTALGFVTVYLSPQPPVDPAQCFEQRASELVRRKTRLAIAHRNTVARSSQTNQPIVIAQVNSNAPAGGDGSSNQPFNSISQAATTVGPNGIIFVREGTFNESVALQDGQRLLGDGLADTAPHLLSTQRGVIQIPDQRTRAEVPIPQLIATDPAGAIQLNQNGVPVNNVEIAGLSISNMASPAIVGFANDGFSIHHNTIGPTSDFGVLLVNASGTEFNNPTAPTSPTNLASIADNIIQNNGQAGVVIANVDIPDDAFMDTGLDPESFNISLDPQGPLEVTISGNVIQDNGDPRNITGAATRTDLATAIGTIIVDTDNGVGPRDDRFGVQIVNLTSSPVTATLDDNSLLNNGLEQATYWGLAVQPIWTLNPVVVSRYLLVMLPV